MLLFFSVLSINQAVTSRAWSATARVSRNACHVQTQLPCSEMAFVFPTVVLATTVKMASVTVKLKRF